MFCNSPRQAIFPPQRRGNKSGHIRHLHESLRLMSRSFNSLSKVQIDATAVISSLLVPQVSNLFAAADVRAEAVPRRAR